MSTEKFGKINLAQWLANEVERDLLLTSMVYQTGKVEDLTDEAVWKSASFCQVLDPLLRDAEIESEFAFEQGFRIITTSSIVDTGKVLRALLGWFHHDLNQHMVDEMFAQGLEDIWFDDEYLKKILQKDVCIWMHSPEKEHFVPLVRRIFEKNLFIVMDQSSWAESINKGRMGTLDNMTLLTDSFLDKKYHVLCNLYRVTQLIFETGALRLTRPRVEVDQTESREIRFNLNLSFALDTEKVFILSRYK